jgi:hypothetical protein
MSDARRHLQPELFDSSEFEGPVSHLPAREAVMAKREEYGDARQHGNLGLNPLHDPRASTINWAGGVTDYERGRFIPTESIVSSQPQISHDAVSHLVANSSGLDTPDIAVRQGTGELSNTYALRDGNHRVNAALARGQMLIPAEVTYDRENGR